MATPSSASRLVLRVKSYRDRRPHRSFRLTRRRDSLKPLQLPGYLAFTKRVNMTVWRHKRIFLSLTAIYIALYALLVGVGSQESYNTITDSLNESSQGVFEGNWGEIGKASVLFMSVASTGFNDAPTDLQQVIMAILLLLAWLSTVWLLRHALAGKKVTVRDALYNSGAPIVPTAILTGVLIIQLIPVGIAALGYAAADATGLTVVGGVETMLFWIAAALLTLLSLYWMSSTFFAMVIVTLPGTHPFRALSIAGDMVVGRRVKILLRALWVLPVILLAWAIVMVPVILFDSWLKSVVPAIAELPLVPFVLLIVASVTTFWLSSYVYLLYREIVDEDAKHAKK